MVITCMICDADVPDNRHDCPALRSDVRPPARVIAEQDLYSGEWRILDESGVWLSSVRHRHQVETEARRAAMRDDVHVTYRPARKGSVKRARES